MPGEKYYKTLTIAGSDCSGGAGIQADLKTFSAIGCYGMSVICALTAQNTLGVKAIHEVPADFTGLQLDAIFTDLPPDAVKIGMLQRSDVVEVVADRLRKYNVSRIVLDPVMVAKSGHRLLRDDAINALRDELLPLAALVTPNLPESSVLCAKPIRTKDDMPMAGERLISLGAGAALVKGGHLDGDRSDDCLVYIDSDGKTQIRWYEHERVQTKNTHGTGCTLSSAVAAYLARGLAIAEAVESAVEYLARALRDGAKYEIGHGHGPVNHFAGIWPK